MQQLGGELGALKSSVNANAQEFRTTRAAIADLAARYQTIVAGITARLQVGTTPGNPELIAQWNEAQGLLSQLEQNVGRLSALSTRVAANASTSSSGVSTAPPTRRGYSPSPPGERAASEASG